MPPAERLRLAAAVGRRCAWPGRLRWPGQGAAVARRVVACRDSLSWSELEVEKFGRRHGKGDRQGEETEHTYRHAVDCRWTPGADWQQPFSPMKLGLIVECCAEVAHPLLHVGHAPD